jgi:hypothetical protein
VLGMRGADRPGREMPLLPGVWSDDRVLLMPAISDAGRSLLVKFLEIQDRTGTQVVDEQQIYPGYDFKSREATNKVLSTLCKADLLRKGGPHSYVLTGAGRMKAEAVKAERQRRLDR